MDPAQALLVVIIAILSVILVILGIQVFFILREFRRALTKANKVLDDTRVITESVSGPLASLSTLTSGVKLGAVIASFLKGKKRHEKGEDHGERA